MIKEIKKIHTSSKVYITISTIPLKIIDYLKLIKKNVFKLFKFTYQNY